MFRVTAVRVVAALAASLAIVLAAACTSDEPEPEFEGTLSVGVLLPGGNLAHLADTLTAAVEVARVDINEADGVWGSDVTVEFYDEDEPVETLVAAGHHAVIGPLATERSLELLEPLRDAGILLVSPASPGIVLDDHPARDYYLRVRPSDTIQAVTLAQELISNAYERVAVVARDDPYGEGLSAELTQRLAPDGEEREVVAIRYQDEPDVAEVVAEVAEAEPDAVVLISYEEGTAVLAELAGAGLSPADADGPAWYLVSGNLRDYSADLPAGALAGVNAVAPAPVAEREELWERMDEQVSGLTDYLYGAEAFDALITIALGAVAADTDDRDAIRAAMVDISRDPPDQPCFAFAACRSVLAEGRGESEFEGINYVGESGPIDWSDTGDARFGEVGLYQYGEDNTFERLDVLPARL